MSGGEDTTGAETTEFTVTKTEYTFEQLSAALSENAREAAEKLVSVMVEKNMLGESGDTGEGALIEQISQLLVRLKSEIPDEDERILVLAMILAKVAQKYKANQNASQTEAESVSER
jgi:hypothetical protein